MKLLFVTIIALSSFTANASDTEIREQFAKNNKATCEAWRDNSQYMTKKDELVGQINISVDFSDAEQPIVTAASKTEELNFQFGKNICGGRESDFLNPTYVYDSYENNQYLVYKCVNNNSSWLFTLHSRLSYSTWSESFVVICNEGGTGMSSSCYNLKNCKFD